MTDYKKLLTHLGINVKELQPNEYEEIISIIKTGSEVAFNAVRAYINNQKARSALEQIALVSALMLNPKQEKVHNESKKFLH